MLINGDTFVKFDTGKETDKTCNVGPDLFIIMKVMKELGSF